jgi:hypothetical protein
VILSISLLGTIISRILNKRELYLGFLFSLLLNVLIGFIFFLILYNIDLY